MTPKDLLPFLAPALILVLVARRFFRAQKPQRIRPNRLWIGPVIVALPMALVLWTAPRTDLLAVALFAVALAVGLGFGYLRALHQTFSIEPETGNVMSQASPIGMVIFIGIFALRYMLNSWMHQGTSPVAGKPPSPELLLYTDAMLFFAFGMVSATAWEVWRRTRPLVIEHRASAAANPLSAEPPAP